MKQNSKRQAGTGDDSSTKDDATFVGQHSRKLPVVCSQSPTIGYNAFDLMNAICDGLIAFKASVSCSELYKVKTTIELPKESYNRFVDFIKENVRPDFDEKNFLYAGFAFCVKESE